MSFKKFFLKKVNISPPPGNGVCHNLNCRSVLGKHWKILNLPNGYKAEICLHCWLTVGRKGFRYGEINVSARQLRSVH